MKVGTLLGGVGLAVLIGFLPAAPAPAAETLERLEVRVGGQPVRTWTRARVGRLPQADFTIGREGKRTAVLVSTLLDRSGVPLDRLAAARVTGLGGDTKKGPATKAIAAEKGPGQTWREFRGDGRGEVLARVVVFYNPDRHWTLADLEPVGGKGPWDQRRVRKVRHIDVTLR